MFTTFLRKFAPLKSRHPQLHMLEYLGSVVCQGSFSGTEKGHTIFSLLFVCPGLVDRRTYVNVDPVLCVCRIVALEFVASSVFCCCSKPDVIFLSFCFSRAV